jgi:hypothetical protein
MYVFHEHKYIIAGSQGEHRAWEEQVHEHLQVPANGGKIG